MFAGEGDAFRTNRRFKYLSEHSEAKRLSTAFDSVTLYGRDPATPPDVYGKVGTSGVSIATLEDMEALYDGFDLCSPTTSVSMTINGPAPTILAFFLNTAIDQQVDSFAEEHGREPDDDEREHIAAFALANVRGTVQADILKEDQGQNTCIFSTEFSLRMMADIQEWFIAAQGPQLLLGVDLRLPHRRGRGEPHQPAGLHPGQRVHLRRVLPRPRHGRSTTSRPTCRSSSPTAWTPSTPSSAGSPGGSGPSRCASATGRTSGRQKLKYHVQTSGRSLHAQEMDFNDIRTTLQALCALYDNANSLHTNAYDEAVTTPDAKSRSAARWPSS